MFIKYANAKVIGYNRFSGVRKTASAKLSNFDYEPRNDGHKYLYVAARACTADVPNLNMDMLPHKELKTAYKTFIGSYVYLNHDNTDPAKARGVIIDAKYHTENPDDKWVEILMEMDEEKCPKLCALIRSGEIDTVSMGCSIDNSECSICGNVAEYPFEFCEHIQQKGREFNGKLAYEICNGIEFFEESWVYEPADSTAYVQAIGKTAGKKTAMAYSPSKRFKKKYDELGITFDNYDELAAEVWSYGRGRYDDEQYAEVLSELAEMYGFDIYAPDLFDKSAGVILGESNRAPEEISTEKTEQACPLCQSLGFDGEICDVCGYQEPPEGLDDIIIENDENFDDEIEIEENYDFEDEQMDDADKQALEDEIDNIKESLHKRIEFCF